MVEKHIIVLYLFTTIEHSQVGGNRKCLVMSIFSGSSRSFFAGISFLRLWTAATFVSTFNPSNLGPGEAFLGELGTVSVNVATPPSGGIRTPVALHVISMAFGPVTTPVEGGTSKRNPNGDQPD